MNYHTYILYSDTARRHYNGSCEDLSSRLDRHNRSMVPSTRYGVPWKLVWSKELQTRSEAMRLEKKIKKRGAQRFLEDLKKHQKDSR